MMSALKKMIGAIAALAFPDKCPGCSAPAEPDSFCLKCLDSMRRISRPICLKCGNSMPAGVSEDRAECSWCAKQKVRFDSCRSAVLYQDSPAKRAVVRLKFHRRRAVAAVMSALMLDYLNANRDVFPQFSTLDMVAPVPLHWRRQFNRGFNQSALIAEHVASKTGVQAKSALKRIKYNKPQSKLRLKDRRMNVKGVFAANPKCDITGAKILLIDDVLTSGSTVIECARTLKQGGAAEVHVFTFARRTLAD